MLLSSLNNKMSLHCAGKYCGRILNGNGNWSECNSCPRGFRVNNSFACAPCENQPDSYSWMYLGYMTLLPLLLHYIYINLNNTNIRFSNHQLLCYASSFLETFLSGMISILLVQPVWSFKLEACNVNSFADWYTLFHNPIPNYGSKLQCTQEAVYPLQTILVLFYFLALVTMLLIRPLLILCGISIKSQIYSGLHFLPVLAVLHIAGSGIIYYTFPYQSIVISTVTNALHFSLKMDQSFKALVLSIRDCKSLLLLSGNSSLLAYGIISLHRDYVSLPVIILPPIFYIITVRFTDPTEFQERREN